MGEEFQGHLVETRKTKRTGRHWGKYTHMMNDDPGCHASCEASSKVRQMIADTSNFPDSRSSRMMHFGIVTWYLRKGLCILSSIIPTKKLGNSAICAENIHIVVTVIIYNGLRSRSMHGRGHGSRKGYQVP